MLEVIRGMIGFYGVEDEEGKMWGCIFLCFPETGFVLLKHEGYFRNFKKKRVERCDLAKIGQEGPIERFCKIKTLSTSFYNTVFAQYNPLTNMHNF